MSGTLDDILNDCLERLARGESAADCVGRYPDHEAQLAPLLEVAAPAMGVVSSASFSPDAKARGLQRLMAAASQRKEGPLRRARISWRPLVARPLVAGLAAVLLTTGMAFSVTAASSNSVPGEPLYVVKTARESISLMVPQSDTDRAKTHIRLAGVRGEEMRRLMASDRFQAAEEAGDRIRHHLNASAGFIGLMTSTNTVEMPHRPAVLIKSDVVLHEVMDLLQHDLGSLRSDLIEAGQDMPAPDRRRADMIRLRSEMLYRTIVSAMEGAGSPSWGPFWREEPPRSRSR